MHCQLESASHLSRVHTECTQQYCGGVRWLQIENPQKHLLRSDVFAPSHGLPRILKYSLRRGSHPDAIVYDGLDGWSLGNWMHPKRRRVDALRNSQSTECLPVKRVETVSSLRQTHSQHGFDLRFLQQA